MDNIRNTAALVKEALNVNPRTRNSDSYLYYVICKAKLEARGVAISSLSFKDGLLKRKEYDIPAFETVRRTRQKIQAENPELAGNEETEVKRALREEAFRDYARGRA